ESRAAVAPRADASPPRRTASGCAFGGGERRPRRLPALLRQSQRTPAPAASGRAAERGGNAAPATRTLRAGRARQVGPAQRAARAAGSRAGGGRSAGGAPRRRPPAVRPGGGRRAP